MNNGPPAAVVHPPSGPLPPALSIPHPQTMVRPPPAAVPPPPDAVLIGAHPVHPGTFVPPSVPPLIPQQPPSRHEWLVECSVHT